MKNPIYSIIIPLKDEEGNITSLVEEIRQVMEQLGEPWELICVDDGSQDTTPQILESLQKELTCMRTLTFERNYGQSSAFDAGFKEAKGEYLITLDGDGQNDPKDIPKLTALAGEFDLICGIRQKRKDPPHKKIISKIANKVRRAICDDGAQDTGCSLKLYRRECLSKIKMYSGMHRFLPALFVIEGYRVGQQPVSHRERKSGKTKYNFFNRSFNTVADLFAVRWMKKRQLRYRIKDRAQ